MIFRNKHILTGQHLWVFGILLGVLLTSCEKYVSIDKAPNMLETADVYTTDNTATSAVLGIYSYYYTPSALQYFTLAGELESAEMEYQYAASTADLSQLQQSAVSPANVTLTSYMWQYPYMTLRAANLAVEGVTASTTLSAAVKSQLLGEAKFIRAYVYFHMVNYFGKVPLVLSSDAKVTALQPRDSVSTVYAQIIADLKSAEELMPAVYTSTTRTRPNKYAAAALLARVYLYQKDYANAEAEASKVIGASEVTYGLPALANAFVNTSNEVIFQVGTTYGYSFFGSSYRTTASTGIPSYYLTAAAANVFESGDGRRATWVDSVISGPTTYYRVNKYKLSTATAGNEYNVMLRLGEQYLIRAEARAYQNNISGSQDDLNAVRGRAGLLNTPAANTGDLVTAVMKERQAELFGETGHRWFDLKRTNKADDVLKLIKPTTWKSTAVLLPIPYTERLKNTNLTQNDGYDQ